MSRTALALVALALVTGCGTSAPAAAPSVSPVASPTSSEQPQASVPVPSAAVAQPAAGSRPVRLAVPSVGIDTSLLTLDIAADGSLEVPGDDDRAGWLDRSPVPGDRGPAVLAGHVDSTRGPAVFFRLREVAPGDQVLVTREDGSTVAFRVDGVQQYAKDAFPTAAVYGPSPGPVLRLITCGGVFDRSTGHYRSNVVVYATAASSTG